MAAFLGGGVGLGDLRLTLAGGTVFWDDEDDLDNEEERDECLTGGGGGGLGLWRGFFIGLDGPDEDDFERLGGSGDGDLGGGEALALWRQKNTDFKHCNQVNMLHSIMNVKLQPQPILGKGKSGQNVKNETLIINRKKTKKLPNKLVQWLVSMT